MKCLEKDPRRSYRTATALADDLPRFLRSEPILARPIGPLERLAKWVNRRPYQAVLVAVATLDRSMHLIDAVLLELPNDRTVIREQLQSRTKRAMFLWQVRKEPTQPLSELKRAVADGKRLVHADPRSIEARADLAWCLHDLGSVLLECGSNQEALSAHRRAIDLSRALCRRTP